MTAARILAFAATCVLLSTYPFVSTRNSVLLWLFLYLAQYALLFWQWRHNGFSRQTILATALLFRLLLLPAGYSFADGAWQRFLVFDHDVWRFLWDGHVAAHGFSPYAHPPSSPALDSLAEDSLIETGPWPLVRTYINYPDFLTVYPPAAQACFRLCHALLPGSPLGPKLLSVAADLAITAMLPLPWALLYAWNPLALKAGAASGHVDAVLGLLLLLLVRNFHRPWLASLLYALGLLFKLSPLVLAPWFLRWLGWRSSLLAATLFALAWLPYAGDSANILAGLQAFASGWQFNAPLFYGLSWLTGNASLARTFLSLAIVAAALALLRCKLEPSTQAAWTLSALVLLSPAVMPWYLLWALPLALQSQQWGPVLYGLPMGLAMFIMVNGTEPSWALATEALLLISITAITFPRPPAKRQT